MVTAGLTSELTGWSSESKYSFLPLLYLMPLTSIVGFSIVGSSAGGDVVLRRRNIRRSLRHWLRCTTAADKLGHRDDDAVDPAAREDIFVSDAHAHGRALRHQRVELCLNGSDLRRRSAGGLDKYLPVLDVEVVIVQPQLRREGGVVVQEICRRKVNDEDMHLAVFNAHLEAYAVERETVLRQIVCRYGGGLLPALIKAHCFPRQGVRAGAYAKRQHRRQHDRERGNKPQNSLHVVPPCKNR